MEFFHVNLPILFDNDSCSTHETLTKSQILSLFYKGESLFDNKIKTFLKVISSHQQFVNIVKVILDIHVNVIGRVNLALSLDILRPITYKAFKKNICAMH